MRIMICPTKYQEKKNAKIYMGKIVNECVTEDISVKELAEKVTVGYPVRPGILKVGCKQSDDWIAQSIFMIDIDNDNIKGASDYKYITIEEAYNLFNNLGITPIFIYKTYTYNEEEGRIRFRIVFCTDEEITDKAKRDKLQATLMHMIMKDANADTTCFAASKVFLGTSNKDILYASYDSRINADAIIEKYYKDDYLKKSEKNISESPEVKKDKVHTDNSNIICQHVDLIRDKDVEGLRDELNIIDTEELKLVDNIQKAVDMAEYLGVVNSKSFCCALHPDRTPSANIFQINGIDKYKCFSDNCGSASKVLDVVCLTQKLQDTTRYEATKFLSEVYGVTSQDLIYMQKQDKYLHNQLNFFKNKISCYEQLYRFYNKLDKDFKIIEGLINLLISKINEVQKTIDGRMVVRVCLDEINAYMMKNGYIKKSDNAKMSAKISAYCLIGLINKHSKTELCDKTVKYYEKCKNPSTVKNEMLILSIPEYTYELFNSSNEIASVLIKYRFKISDIDEKSVASLFCIIDELKRVFPNYKADSLKYLNISFLQEKYFTILKEVTTEIDNKGYFLNNQLSELLGNKNYNCMIPLLAKNYISIYKITNECKCLYPELNDLNGSNNYIFVRDKEAS